MRVQEGVELQGCGERGGMAQGHLPGGWTLAGRHDGGQNGASLGDWTPPPGVKRDRGCLGGDVLVFGATRCLLLGFFFLSHLACGILVP